jgi:hypothetical protein
MRLVAFTEVPARSRGTVASMAGDADVNLSALSLV